MDNNNCSSPAKQLRKMAEQLMHLADAFADCECQAESCGSQAADNAGGCPCEEAAACTVEEEATACAADLDEEQEDQAMNSEAANSESADSEDCAQKADSQAEADNCADNEKQAEKVTAKPMNSNQIGGGLFGAVNGFNMKNMPGLGNLFGGLLGGAGGLGGLGNLGGLGGLGGLAGLNNAPKSVEELKNNPQLMSVLGSLESNPTLLSTIAGLSGMDKDQILSSIKALQGSVETDAADTASSTTADTAAADSSQAAANPLGNLNLNSLNDLSRLFGGQANGAGQAPAAAAPMGQSGIMQNMPAGMQTMPLRGTIGGDPLMNLLNQWHWHPLRS